MATTTPGGLSLLFWLILLCAILIIFGQDEQAVTFSTTRPHPYYGNFKNSMFQLKLTELLIVFLYNIYIKWIIEKLFKKIENKI